MKKQNVLIVLLFLSIAILPIFLFMRGGWIDMDPYGFYGKFCQNGIHIEVPVLSDFIFSHFPCSPEYWFVIQAIIWAINVFLILLALKRFQNLPPISIGVLGFCFSFIYSILSIEDDYLAFGVLFYATLWLFHETTWNKRYTYSALTAFLFLLVWKGAILPMGIFLAASIWPLLGFLPAIIYLFPSFSDNWGGSVEANMGISLITLFPMIFILWFNSREKFWEFFRNNNNFFWGGCAVLLLGSLQAKWGAYAAIFYPSLLWHTMEEKNRRQFLFFGVLFLLIVPGMLALTKPPQKEHWDVINLAVSFEKQGELVYTDWGIRWIYQFVGGHPNEPFVYGQMKPIIEHHYWVGRDKNCQTISRADELFFQECGAGFSTNLYSLNIQDRTS